MSETVFDPKDLERVIKDANEYAQTIKEPLEEKRREEDLRQFKNIINTREALLDNYGHLRSVFEVLDGNNLLKIKLRPIRGTLKDMELLDPDSNIYADLDRMEREIMQKKHNNMDLTENEQKIWNKTESKLENNKENGSIDQINRILDAFVDIVDDNDESILVGIDKELFWESFHFLLKICIFGEVIDRLGLKVESEIQLFQVHRNIGR